MPVVKLTLEKMSLLMGKAMTIRQLADAVPWIGVEIEEQGEDWIRIEYNPNRPDFSSQQGVARALRGLQEIEIGLPKYSVNKGSLSLIIDQSVKEVRPYAVGGVCRNIRLSNSDIEELMAAQEDIHWAIGRDRRKASIGLHNLDAVKPPFRYKGVAPKSVKFTPLGGDRPLDLNEIVSSHPKGIAYKHLVEGFSKFPIIVDKDSSVLSFPPIINGTATQITEATRNLFIDVTGTSLTSINNALNLIVTQLADMGGTIESITITEDEKNKTTPVLRPIEFSVSSAYINKVLGLRLSQDEIALSLKRVRFDVKKDGQEKLNVAVPPYRFDILHEVDLAEEVAIGYGYSKIKPKLPSCLTIGKTHPLRKLESLSRRLMIGLGYQEVMNFTLTNETEHYQFMRTTGTPLVRLANPVSSEYTILRETLLPGLVRTLRANKHEKLPQRVFEVGDVIREDQGSETSVGQQLSCCAVTIHPTANFAEIKSAFMAFAGGFGKIASQISFVTIEHPSFIKGRAAGTVIHDKRIGVLGELHPEVIRNFELEYPMSAFEVDIEQLHTSEQMTPLSLKAVL
jgi:phenylalanyl-tRNA synthetase beta chain